MEDETRNEKAKMERRRSISASTVKSGDMTVPSQSKMEQTNRVEEKKATSGILAWWTGKRKTRRSSRSSGKIAPDRQRSSHVVASQHSADLIRWDFNAGNDMDHMGQMDMLQTMFGLLDAHVLFNITFEVLNDFLVDVKNGYIDYPGLNFHRYYHNFLHAMDVTQTIFAMLHFSDDADESITNIERIIMMIAALGHDIHHPGVSNHFLVTSKHQLVVEYGDSKDDNSAKSGFLERMHAAETRRLVDKYNILSTQSPSEKLHLERLIVTCILNTDMSQHDGLLKHVNGLVSKEKSTFSLDDKLIVCSFFLHCADLSNGAKPWATAERWAYLVMKEFFEQGAAEKELGMPISPNCDAMTTMIPELQIKFIHFAVLPCFVIFQTLYPRAIEPVNCAMANIRQWESKRDQSLTMEQREIVRAISGEMNINRMAIVEDKAIESSKNWEWSLAKTILHHPLYILILSLMSLLIIFEPPLRPLLTSTSFASALASTTIWITVAFFVLDTILSILGDHRYLRSLHFWLDILSLISLIVEAVIQNSWVAGFILLPTLIQPRLVRVGRLVRVVSNISHPSVCFRRQNSAIADSTGFALSVESQEAAMVFQRKDITKLFFRLVKPKHTTVDENALLELLREAYNYEKIPPDALDNLLSYFPHSVQPSKDVSTISVSSLSLDQFANGIQRMELRHNGVLEPPPIEKNQTTESAVGRELSDIVIKRILIIVLVVLLCVPRLDFTPAKSKFTRHHYSLLNVHRYALYLPEEINLSETQNHQTYIKESMNDEDMLYLHVFKLSPILFDAQLGLDETTSMASIGTRCNQDNQIECVQVAGCKFGEVQLILNNSLLPHEDQTYCLSTAIFDKRAQNKTVAEWYLMRNLFILLCVIVSVVYLDYETYCTVRKPIESMLQIVRQLSINPAEKIQVQPGETRNEILLLHNTLVKIASLIQIGFGEAGAEILAGNMLEGDLNPMAHGKNVFAIFGFCSIRHFSKATEILKEDIMQYTNQIGEMVHECVHTYGGHANKNIGSAFFLVWKIPNTSIDVSLVNGSQVPQHMSPKKSNLLSVMESNKATRKFLTIADKALISFLKIQLELYHSQVIDKFQRIINPQQLGSITTRSSPMGFGLHVGWAIEGAIGSRYKIDASYLSPDVNMSARLEAATKQFGVHILFSHTFHKLLSHQVQDMCRLIDCVTVKGSEKPLSLYTFDISNLIEHKNIHITTIQHLSQLQNGLHMEFRPAFDRGVSKYFEGEWEMAKQFIEDALIYQPNDGPSLSLLRFMAQSNYIAPTNWRGFRALHEK